MGTNQSSTSSLSAEYRESLLTSVFLDEDDGEGQGVTRSRRKAKAIDMEKMTMIIWSFREQPEMVSFISNFLAKVRRQCGRTVVKSAISHAR